MEKSLIIIVASFTIYIGSAESAKINLGLTLKITDRSGEDELHTSCGIPTSQFTRRIINGDEVDPGELPWQAYVESKFPFKAGRIRYRCGGAVISSDLIVTAGHCVVRKIGSEVSQLSSSSIKVYLGDIYGHSPPNTAYNVHKIFLHPRFMFRHQLPDRYDIALLRVHPTIEFNSKLHPLCLPEPNEQIIGKQGIVAGWGITKLTDNVGAKSLQKTTVPILSVQQCQNMYESQNIQAYFYPEMMCAGYADGHTDACVGDSGSPLIVKINGRFVLAGITSAGYSCGVKNQPGIYHNVLHSLDWIYFHKDHIDKIFTPLPPPP